MLGYEKQPQNFMKGKPSDFERKFRIILLTRTDRVGLIEYQKLKL